MVGWPPAGFIYQLASVDLGSLYKSRQKLPNGLPDVGSDRPLYQTLKLLGDERNKLMKELKPVEGTKWQADNLDNLMAALEDRDKSGDWDKPIYTWEVCVEFHHLLIGLLLGYGRFLFRLDDVDRRESRWMEDMKYRRARDKETLEGQIKDQKKEDLHKYLESIKVEKAQKGAKTPSKKKVWGLRGKLGGSSSSEKLQARGEVPSQEPSPEVKELEANLAKLAVEHANPLEYPLENKATDKRTRDILMKSILGYSRLLAVTMSSRLFEEHFQTTLQAKLQGKPLALPIEELGETYTNWARFTSGAGALTRGLREMPRGEPVGVGGVMVHGTRRKMGEVVMAKVTQGMAKKRTSMCLRRCGRVSIQGIHFLCSGGGRVSIFVTSMRSKWWQRFPSRVPLCSLLSL
jgi:hypothetical protein